MQTNRKDEFAKQALEGSFWFGAAAVVQKIGGLIFTIILARFLMPEGFGLYNLAISIVAIIFIFSQSAPDNTLTRYLSDFLKDKGKANSAFKFIISRLKFIPILVALGAILLLSYPISNVFLKKPELFYPLLLTAVFFVFTSLEQFFSYLFIAIKKVKYRAYKEILFQLLRIPLILAIFLFVASKPSVNHVLIVLIVSSFITFLFVLNKAHSAAPYLFKKSESLQKKERKRIWKFFAYLSFISGSIVLLGHIDTIILGYLIPDVSAVGLYKAAFFLVSSVASLISLSAVFIPFFVQMEKKKLENAFNKTFKYLMMIAIPAVFGIAVLANYLLALIYGHEYLGATLALYLLAPMVIFSTLVALFRDLFSAKEQPKNVLSVIVPVTILNILLNYLLVSFLIKYSTVFAIAGAALANVVSWAIYAGVLMYFANKNLNLKTDLKLLIKPLFASTMMVLILLSLKVLIKDVNIFNGAFLVITGIVIYLVSMILIKGITKEDYFVVEIFKEKLKSNFRIFHK